MDEGSIDRDAMGKMAKALAFIRGPQDPTTVALRLASETGKPADIKKARARRARIQAVASAMATCIWFPASAIAS